MEKRSCALLLTRSVDSLPAVASGVLVNTLLPWTLLCIRCQPNTTTFTCAVAVAHVDPWPALQVKQGDMSAVLTLYEDELKRPVKSMLFGQLIRTSLILIHKAKLDAENATLAMVGLIL